MAYTITRTQPKSLHGSLHIPASAALSTRETVQATYDLAMSVKDISGAFVECGVAAGAQLAALIQARRDAKQPTREVVAFDSFQGIPLAGAQDDQQPGVKYLPMDRPAISEEARLVSSGISSVSQKGVRDNLITWGYDLAHVSFIEGWFEHTMANLGAVKKNEIALLRLDGDLYSSTKVCLEALMPRMSPNGVVIVDDFALKGCRQAVDEYMDAHGLTPKLFELEGSPGPVWFYLTEAGGFHGN